MVITHHATTRQEPGTVSIAGGHDPGRTTHHPPRSCHSRGHLRDHLRKDSMSNWPTMIPTDPLSPVSSTGRIVPTPVTIARPGFIHLS